MYFQMTQKHRARTPGPCSSAFSTWLRIHARRCFRKGSAVAVLFAFRFAIDTFNLQVRVICHESSVNG